MPPRSRLDVVQARALYEAGHSLTHIAALAGLSASQVGKQLRQAGCPMRSRPRQALRARNQLIRQLRDTEGLSWAEIGQRTGVSPEVARHGYWTNQAHETTGPAKR